MIASPLSVDQRIFKPLIFPVGPATASGLDSNLDTDFMKLFNLIKEIGEKVSTTTSVALL